MLMTLNQMILTVTLTLLTLEADDVFDWVLVTPVLQKKSSYSHQILLCRYNTLSHLPFLRQQHDSVSNDLVELVAKTAI